MTQTEPVPGRPSHPALGLVAEIVAVVGIVICLLLVAGSWVGRAWAQDRLDALSTSAVEALARAVVVSNRARAGLQSGQAEVEGIATTATGIANDPASDSAALQSLVARISPFGDRHRTLRDDYLRLREKATGALDALRLVDRFLPGVSLPEGPVKLVSEMDGRLVELDATITSLAASGAAATEVRAAAGQVAEQAGKLGVGLAAATALTGEVQDGLVHLQGSVDDMNDRISLYIDIGAVAGTALLLYLILLQAALWQLGRGWRAS